MEELKIIVAQNIVQYRMALGITQIELAEKLNYSDKSVSKWERGLSIPDVYVLKQMAELFGVTVDELLMKHETVKLNISTDSKQQRIRRLIITLLACGLVWLVATLVYVILNWLSIRGSWKCFVYAIPTTMIVSTVFSALWGNKLSTALTVSMLVWTLLLSIYIALMTTKSWLLFLIGIPMQVLIILWFRLPKISVRNIFKSK